MTDDEYHTLGTCNDAIAATVCIPVVHCERVVGHNVPVISKLWPNIVHKDLCESCRLSHLQ